MDAKNTSCYLPVLAIETIAKNKYGITSIVPDNTLFQKFYVNYLHDTFDCDERYFIKPNCLDIPDCDNVIEIDCDLDGLSLRAGFIGDACNPTGITIGLSDLPENDENYTFVWEYDTELLELVSSSNSNLIVSFLPSIEPSWGETTITLTITSIYNEICSTELVVIINQPIC